ncbi:hypothetical protein VTJ83DRAFT_44 [Remersonia thermophila]|uniref:Uncharacterized protein n=1 Tax=Remersonia thermophila TaxID=72144 RepID=A0ABR4DJW7_9PEZI
MTSSGNGGTMTMSTRAATAAATASVAGNVGGVGVGGGAGGGGGGGGGGTAAAAAAAAGLTGTGVVEDDVVMGGTSTTAAAIASVTSPTRPATRAMTSSARAAAAASLKPKGSTIVSASLLATVGRDRRVEGLGTSSGGNNGSGSSSSASASASASVSVSARANGGLGLMGMGDRGLEPRARCSQCGRRRSTACHHPDPPPTTSASACSPENAQAAAVVGAGLGPRPRRLSKLKHRAAAALSAAGSSASTSTADPDAHRHHHYHHQHHLQQHHLQHHHHHHHHHHHNHHNHHHLQHLPPDGASVPSVAFSIPPAPPRRPSSTTTTSPASGTPSDSSSPDAMEPPVLSFYGKEPVPLPSRFAHIKRSLVAGHEAELEASWARLIRALRDDVDDIASRGSSLTPSIDFADMHRPEARAAFSRDLKRYGLGLIRGVVPRADAQAAIDETVRYLERQTDFKPPSPQDPTCFDFFWTPAQVRTRAHPRVLEAQRFVMSLWDQNAEDRMATRFPVAYADRLRIHGADIGSVGPESSSAKAKEAQTGDKRPAPDDSDGSDDDGSDDDRDDDEDPKKAAAELLGEFTSSTVIAQVDNGSLERWEPDGYGRGGTYEAVFRGEWEKYDPWDPTHRISATQDLYNGYGVCSIFRMYQGMVALSTIEPGLIRLLPSPKLATAYFLLRPFFSPKTRAPERREGPEWDAFLDPSNWTLDREQSTIIHGAVPGHAQRLTELWHPHLHLRRTLVTIPTLQTGDYIVWHPDLAYHITSNPNVMASRAPSPPPPGEDADDGPSGRPVSILVYVPAAPLTQNNALYLARQRKTFQRGHPSPDFDWTGSGLGSEATHVQRPTETYIAEVGGPAALQSMGLAPFDVAPTPPGTGAGPEKDGDVPMAGMTEGAAAATAAATAAAAAPAPSSSSPPASSSPMATSPTTNATPTTAAAATAAAGSAAGQEAAASMTRAEAEVARLANIILFPDRYDFYMPKAKNRHGSGHHGASGSNAGAAGTGSGSSATGSGTGTTGAGSSSSSGSSSSYSNKRSKVDVGRLLNPVLEDEPRFASPKGKEPLVGR